MKRTLYASVALVPMSVLVAQLSWAQVTTSAMNGIITDKSGEGLPGATVIAVHTPTNTQYVAPTNSEGRFNLQNMRVGGPYTIRVSFVGYKEAVRENIFLSLGQNQRLDINLSESEQTLGEVVVSVRRDPVINAGRTGAATSVQREQIERLPTLNRSLQDFTRLNPQTNGNSVGGSNNRFNNITIDGAVNNDVFGLSGSGTPGGGAGTQPIALDAIQEIQVVVAPYDVKLGNFTGGGINAVTRSGTNELSASIYGYGRNQNTVGRSVTRNAAGDYEKAADFRNYQTGARVGGAIVKDKVFFFLNGEISRRNEPLQFNPGTSQSRFRQGQLDSLATYVRETYGYDVGTTGNITRRTNSDKIFARLDFNLSDRHQLTLRHNYVSAFDDNISRGSANFRYGNNSYLFNSTTNSSVAELNSRFGRFSNNLLLSYNRIRDNRQIAGSLFPQVQIDDNGRRFLFGTERSSAANELDQDIFEFTDNVTASFGKHTVTVGTHNEVFKFRNLFLNNYNGSYTFTSLANFYARRPANISATYSLDPNNRFPAAKFTAAQLGFYAQDEYSPVENVRITAGLRLDVPYFPDKPGFNQTVTTTFGEKIRTDNTPSGQLLWAPRVGFNWDVNNDTKVQLRGGTGIFSGRVPFVWLSNSYINNGLQTGTIFLNNPATFEPNTENIPTTFASGVQRTTEINVMSKDFKIPQVWRTNLAVDFRLPGDIVATLEGIYSKTLNDIYYKDINLKAPIGRLAGPDNRPVYSSSTSGANSRRVNDAYTNVFLLDNTSKGYRYNMTGQLQKSFKSGLNTMVAYTYGLAKDVNSGLSSTANSNWRFNQVQFDPNNPELSFSAFDQRHRVLATGGYTLRYLEDKLATSFSLVYEGLSGRPFTYLYGQGRDLNNDLGQSGNDLLYVPRDQSEITLVPTNSSDTRTPAQIWGALNSFIENDPYLRTRRGQYVERSGARMPWTHQVDIRIAQSLNFLGGGKKNVLEVSLDIINFGNLLNREWGRQYSIANNSVELLRPESTGANVRPTFSFPSSFSTTNRAWDIAPFASRWQGQLGVRYSFN
jgi:Carboxypeptidase regulatory-like domain